MESRLARPLEGLRIGTHYGCHYHRPAGVMGGGAPACSPLPQDMEIILETLGAEVVEYNRQDLCCGAALSINTGASAESLAIADEKLGWMREAELDALAVSCPACFTQFDTGQLLLSRRAAADAEGSRKTGALEGKRAVPVFHIAELVAYALGMGPEEMDLGSHKIKAPWIGR
jgi:heterodisulfide reductase subunit B